MQGGYVLATGLLHRHHRTVIAAVRILGFLYFKI
jgi:hypothetical protein